MDAAAKVLEQESGPRGTSELIELMAKRGLWKSKAGKTPDQTLYVAIIRDIAKNRGKSRFLKTRRGRFAFAG